jgi:endonuclease YncB( thermonuclease family)
LLALACASGCASRTDLTSAIQVTTPSSSTPSAEPMITVTTTAPEQPTMQVAGVVDGRTIVGSDGKQLEIAGLAPPGTCWSQAATEFTRKTLNGKTIKYAKTVGTAATVLMPDGSDFAVEAVRRGMGRAEPGSTTALRSAQSAAEQAGLGLWGGVCAGKDSLDQAGAPNQTPSGSDEVYFGNCDAARRAGLGPIVIGQPGYGKHLDPDGDGIACDR